MPGGIQVFARALDMTTEELFKAMENGELLAGEVLPLVADELKRTARNNDALTKSLTTSRSQWTLFMNNLKLLFDGFGSTRLDRGVANFIKMMGKMLEVLKPLAQTFFYLLGVVFDLVSAVGRGVLTAFDPFLNIFRALEKPIRAVQQALSKTDSEFMQFVKDVSQVGVYFIPILRWFAIIGDVLEEFINIFTGHAQGILAGPGETIGERLANGMIGKGFTAIINYLDTKFLPQIRSKATEIGDAVGRAFANGVQNAVKDFSLLGWMFDQPNIDKLNQQARERGAPPETRTMMPGSGAPRIIINMDGKEVINREIDTRFDQEYKGSLQ